MMRGWLTFVIFLSAAMTGGFMALAVEASLGDAPVVLPIGFGLFALMSFGMCRQAIHELKSHDQEASKVFRGRPRDPRDPGQSQSTP